MSRGILLSRECGLSAACTRLHLFGGTTVKLKLTRRTGELLLAAVIITRSASLLLSKLGLADMGPVTLMALRFSTASILLLALFWRRLRAAGKGDLMRGAAIGAAFFAVLTSELFGLRHTSTSTASFLENTSVVLVPLLLAVAARKLPGAVTLISALLSLTGVGLLTLRPGAGIGAGELLCMLTALLYAGAIILTDRLSHKGGDTLAMGIAQVCTIAVLAFMAAFIFEAPIQIPARVQDWGIILGLAVVCTGFGFTLQPVAQSATTAERSAMFCALNPLSASILGVVFLDEELGVLGVTGAALILCGILLPNVLEARKSAAKAATHGT